MVYMCVVYVYLCTFIHNLWLKRNDFIYFKRLVKPIATVNRGITANMYERVHVSNSLT